MRAEQRDIVLKRTRDMVRSRLEAESTGHDWPHIERVSELALRIAAEEGADPFICELAALLHDLADDKLVDHEEDALAELRHWLERQEVPTDEIDHVMEIISTMSYRGGTNPPPRTLEGRTVQDADRLDALGAIGIARTFYYAGAKGHELHQPGRVPRASMTKETYRNEPGTAVNHFYEKLLRLKDLMNTSCARRLAEERHRFMEDYLKQFLNEWNVKNRGE